MVVYRIPWNSYEQSKLGYYFDVNSLFTKILTCLDQSLFNDKGYAAFNGLAILLNQLVQELWNFCHLLERYQMFTAGIVCRNLYELTTYLTFILSDFSLFERRSCAFYYSMYLEDLSAYFSGMYDLLIARKIIDNNKKLTKIGVSEFNYLRKGYYSTFWCMLSTFSWKDLKKIEYNDVHVGKRLVRQKLDNVIWYDECCNLGKHGAFASLATDIVHMDGYETVYVPLCSFVHDLNYVGEFVSESDGSMSLGQGYFNMYWRTFIYQKLVGLLWRLRVVCAGHVNSVVWLIDRFLNIY